MQEQRLTEPRIVACVRDYLLHSANGYWQADTARLHAHGADLVLWGGPNGSERFIIECKGKSYAASPCTRAAINKEGWLNALGQLITRMDRPAEDCSCRYGLGLYWEGAQVALRRIPASIARTLNLHIFSVDDDGWVRHWTPECFGQHHPEESFHS